MKWPGEEVAVKLFEEATDILTEIPISFLWTGYVFGESRSFTAIFPETLQTNKMAVARIRVKKNVLSKVMGLVFKLFSI